MFYLFLQRIIFLHEYDRKISNVKNKSIPDAVIHLQLLFPSLSFMFTELVNSNALTLLDH